MLVALAALTIQAHNTLSPAEVKAGWKLLFDGKTTNGWNNFKEQSVSDGWAVQDGVLTIIDANKAGDIVTKEKFDWFELKLDFNIGAGQNSGVMYHVADGGEAIWHSGPEIQIYDDRGRGGEITGWLYQLYQSPIKTTNRSGEWNRMRILVSPKLCQTDINGCRYYTYVLGSPDFNARVAKSKFAQFPQFGKLGNGRIGIQGDHGNVSFRNIKIRRIK